MIRQSVLLDLDTLVDTRLGLLRQHWPDKAKGIDIAAWVSRLDFKCIEALGITREEWDKKWALRDADTVKLSMSTELLYNIDEVMSAAIARGIVDAPFMHFDLTINFWPYQLAVEEIAEICNLVKSGFIFELSVSAIRESHAKLSNVTVADEWDVYIMYDFVSWISLHADSINKTPTPKLTIVYPMLLNAPNQEVLELYAENGQSPFDELMRVMAPVIVLEAIDTSTFSIPLGSSLL